ncbi:hypothetical protein RAJCM14343_0672 [Rhodococcus aetherivorans]|uniref:Uncharacterized protein n=1 Tax=Rhodococcus aetherivorans TaxID=191292 RepID=A0ABQ0YFV8_9NOCA|nr:hypothetical protein RAJCM14343_0672 [Rhodococcus aetherivorans]
MGPVDSLEQIGLGVDPRSCDSRCSGESGDGDRLVSGLQVGERSLGAVMSERAATVGRRS